MAVALYGCETRSLTFKEECRQRALKTAPWSEYLDQREMRIGNGYD